MHQMMAWKIPWREGQRGAHGRSGRRSRGRRVHSRRARSRGYENRCRSSRRRGGGRGRGARCRRQSGRSALLRGHGGPCQITGSGEADAGSGAARARKAVPAPSQPRAGGGERGRGIVGVAKRHKEIERIGGCGRGGGCPGSPEQQRRGLGSGRTMRSARRRGIERSGSTSGPRRSVASARKTG
jgi:hypothetical protein